MTKLIVILGPTASGKSSLAIKLARKFNGEIISADSRQVYKGMDIGTGKVTKKERKIVPHHLLDITSPKKQYSVAEYQRDAKSAAAQIASRGKLPFVVGGSAFYIYAAVDNLQIPEVKPNLKLRKVLAKKTAGELFVMLKKLDPRRVKTIDRHNPARLIRAIEIVKTTGKPIPQFTPPPLGEGGRRPGEGVLFLGIKKSPTELRKLINKRVDQRFRQGLVMEVKKLLRSGVSIRRLKQIGLTYALVADLLQNGRSTKTWYRQLIGKIQTAEWQFARRQETWFKRDPRIHWIQNQKQAEMFVKAHLERSERSLS